MLLAVVLETPIASANASWATRRSRRAAFRRWPTSRATRRAISGVREEDRDAAMAVNVVIQCARVSSASATRTGPSRSVGSSRAASASPRCSGVGRGRRSCSRRVRRASGSRGTWSRSATTCWSPIRITRRCMPRAPGAPKPIGAMRGTLMDACQTGAYRLAHRLSDPRRHVRAELAVRDALVRTRTRYVALAKTLVRRDGLRVASSESHLVAQRIGALSLSPVLAAELQPLFAVLAPLNEQIAAAYGRIARLAATDPLVARLATAPAIGPVTASAVVATVDDITRFRSAHQFEAYFGLVPGERSSGEKRHVGPITKAGNSRVRWLLVEEIG